MIKNILKVFNILLIFSCHTVQTSISKPPEIQNLIEEIKMDTEIQTPVKNKIIKTLELSQEYNSECFNKNILLEKENFSLKEKIQNLELEIQTWRTIKNIGWILIVIFILSMLYKFRKLFGVLI